MQQNRNFNVVFTFQEFRLSSVNIIRTTMKHELKDRIAVVNNKGGVGKTTTVQTLASILNRRSKDTRVLCIDLDPQGNLSTLYGFDGKGRTIYDALVEYNMDKGTGNIPIYKTEDGIYYSPSSSLLQGVDVSLNQQLQPTMTLFGCMSLPVDDHTGDGLGVIIDDFDYLFFDCPPALSRTTYNAMVVATGVLIPVQLEGLSVNGLGSIVVEMLRVRKDINHDLQLTGIVPVMADLRGNITKGYLNFLPEQYGEHVTKTYIRRCLKVVEAQNSGEDVTAYAPGCNASVDYKALATELFPRRRAVSK